MRGEKKKGERRRRVWKGWGGGGLDSDGDLGRYEGKGQWVLKNMKDKDRKPDGFRGKRGSNEGSGQI